jgi:hypothetical protein
MFIVAFHPSSDNGYGSFDVASILTKVYNDETQCYYGAVLYPQWHLYTKHGPTDIGIVFEPTKEMKHPPW